MLCVLHFVVLQLQNKVKMDYFTLHSDDNLDKSRLNTCLKTQHTTPYTTNGENQVKRNFTEMLTGNLDNNLSEKINDNDKKHVDRNYL